MFFLFASKRAATTLTFITTTATGALWLPIVMGQETSKVVPINAPVPSFPNELPYIGGLIEAAFPTWCIDQDDQRTFDAGPCDDGTPNGRFSPLYFSKEFSGGDPDLGGYPTNIDIQYVFEFAAPYLGQACAGSPHHCSKTFDGTTENCKKCPKVKTDNDSGPNGPGHLPPHIALAAVKNYYNKIVSDPDVEASDTFVDVFDYDQNACRILPNVLLSMIRESFPRDEDTGEVKYPPPFSEAGGAYPLEFVNLAGESCEKEKAKHPDAGALECFEQHSGNVSLYPDNLEVGHGSPHYCTKEGKEADVNDDWCPYISFGPNRGKYRHPHIAFAAVETYLAHLIMPENCGTTWDDSNYPAAVDTTVAFPYMKDIGGFSPAQPLIDEDGKWIWPGPEGTKEKPVQGLFAFDLYIPEEPELIGEDYCTYAPDKSCYESGWPSCCLKKDAIPCPEDPEPCAVGIPVLWGSYCTHTPDPSCYTNGYPECCSSDEVECPDEPGPCDVDESESPIFGSSYCTYSPDKSCYSSGWPVCCGDESIDCPKEKPACDAECETLAEIVCEISLNLSELCGLVLRAGLGDALSSGSWTIFAPKNGGFDDLDIQNFSKDKLRRLVLFHLVADEELYSSDLKCTSPDNLITMANGFDSRTLCISGTPTFQKGRENSSKDPPIIVQEDVEACNGVLHVLSDVMIFKEYD